MDQIDLLAAAANFRPLAAAEFLASLQRLEFQSPAWLYETQFTDLSPWQGDVIQEGDIHWTSDTGDPVHYAGPVMLLSHGCETELRDPAALLAPVLDLADFMNRPELHRYYDTSEKRRSLRDAITANSIVNLFFLPAIGRFPDRIVHFSYASAVANTVIQQEFQRAEPSHRLRLTERGWYLLTAKLAHLVGRVESLSDYPRKGRV